MGDGAEFQAHQRVRVREDGGDPSVQPATRFLGKEGTIQYGTREVVVDGAVAVAIRSSQVFRNPEITESGSKRKAISSAPDRKPTPIKVFSAFRRD